MSWDSSVWLLPSQDARSRVVSPVGVDRRTSTTPRHVLERAGVRRHRGLVGALRAARWRVDRSGPNSVLSCSAAMVRRGVRRQHPVVDAAPLHAEERRRDGQQDDDDADGDQRPGGASRRAPAGPTRRGRSSTGGGPVQERASGRASIRRAEQRERRRQDGQRGQHRDQDGRDAAVPDRLEEGLREDQQRAHRRGDGQRRRTCTVRPAVAIVADRSARVGCRPAAARSPRGSG